MQSHRHNNKNKCIVILTEKEVKEVLKSYYKLYTFDKLDFAAACGANKQALLKY